MSAAADLDNAGVNVTTLLDAEGASHVVMIVERADGEPPLLLSLSADMAVAAAGALVASALAVRDEARSASVQ